MEKKLEIDEHNENCLVVRVPGWKVAGKAWSDVLLFLGIGGLLGLCIIALTSGVIVSPDISIKIGCIIFIGPIILILLALYAKLIHLYYINKEIVIDKRSGTVNAMVYYIPSLKMRVVNQPIANVAKVEKTEILVPGSPRMQYRACIAIEFKNGRKWVVCFEPDNSPGSANNPLTRDEYNKLYNFLSAHLPSSKDSKPDE
nr:hypothetical protein [Candidatus Sigynarchaeota archaeon]